jgi:D-beta-D-heptose 7-phosphate kinase/D-beta-D-heptose 1-phosphate adenosyltransferase
VRAAAQQVYDVTGAGDTAITFLALALAAGAPLGAAMRLANRAAGVVVGKVGTATVTLDELRAGR